MAAPFQGAILQCKVCDSAFKVPPSRAAKAEYCSIKCAAIGKKKPLQDSACVSCANCGGVFRCPPSHHSRRIFCSRKCKHESADYRTGIAERGRMQKNAAWRGGFVGHTDGYTYAIAPDHPFASNGYVLAHRLVMERWLRLSDPTSIYLVRLGNGLYLSPEYVVHHRDGTKRNNSVSNLQCLTPAEHTRLHSQARRRPPPSS